MANNKQTPHAIAAMRNFLPFMKRLLTSPAVHDSLRIQGQGIDWDAFNEIEETCGEPRGAMPGYGSSDKEARVITSSKCR